MRPGIWSRRAVLYFAMLLAVGRAYAGAPYQLSYPTEIAYFATGGGMVVAGALLDQRREPLTVTQVGELNRDRIPFFDRPVAGAWNRAAQTASDGLLVLGFAAPLPLLYSQRDNVFTLGVLYLETFSLSGGAMLFAKGAVSRYRPFVYGDSAPMSEKLEADAKRSFFSGHAALISSGFVFSATVFSDYYPDSEYKPYVWSAAVGASLLGAWARVAGGKHFPSDVAAGLIIGSAVGYAVPAMHRGPRSVNVVPFVDGDKTGVVLHKRF